MKKLRYLIKLNIFSITNCDLITPSVEKKRRYSFVKLLCYRLHGLRGNRDLPPPAAEHKRHHCLAILLVACRSLHYTLGDGDLIAPSVEKKCYHFLAAP